MTDQEIPHSEKFRNIAKRWVAAESAANMLEETKTSILAKRKDDLGDMPVSRSEMTIKAYDEWHEYIWSMVDARTKASLLKVQKEFILMQFHEWQSYEASRRAEMKL
jgi:hypothetical protein